MATTCTRDNMILALIRNDGDVHLSLVALGLDEATMWQLIGEYKLEPVLAELRKLRQSRLVGKAEKIVEEALDNGETWAAEFTLKRLGKREWAETQVIEQTKFENKIIKPEKPKTASDVKADTKEAEKAAEVVDIAQ